MKLILISIIGLSSAQLALGSILSDSFDDNSRDPLIWASPLTDTNIIQFIEQNQRTEFFVTGSSTNEAPAAAWQDALNRLTTELDWTLTVDLQNSWLAPGSNFVAVGVSLYNYDFTDEAGLYLTSTNSELKLYRSFNELFYPAPPEEIEYQGVLTNSGSIRFSYAATNQTVEIAYANTNSSFDRLYSVDTSDWQDINSTGFILSMSAVALRADVISGQVSLDNVLVNLGIEPTIMIEQSGSGIPSIRFTGNLVYTDNLQNGWKPVHAATTSPFIVATTNSQMFFRTTMP